MSLPGYSEKEPLPPALPAIEDPWALVDLPATEKPWKDKTCAERLKHLGITITKVVVLLGLLYLFICSLDFLGNAFKLLGGAAAGKAFTNSAILSNPVGNMMMGVLATVLLQSSSTTTSITVAMVASEILPVRPAIFVIMGANIGTSVTNTLVSMGQLGNRNEFRRAFAGATIHDFFNWLSVLILLPIEWISGSFGSWNGCGILCQVTGAITKNLQVDPSQSTNKELLKVITKPFTKLFVQIDKKMIMEIAKGNVAAEDASLIKHCKKTIEIPFVFRNNDTDECTLGFREETVKDKCGFMFESISETWSDAAIGACLLVIALAILCICLVLIVKLLHSMLQGQMARIIKKFINSDFPGCARHLTGYLAILIGAGLTMLVQSSSIFTSAITPLVGVGVLHIDRMYPLTLGANIGTTFTAILAALAADRDHLADSLQVALCHLFFNIIGIMIWYPIPFMRNVPISMAKAMGQKTCKYRWFSIVYLIFMFFVLPAGVFGLSIAGWKVCLGVVGPLFVLFIVIVIINILQKKRPKSLPSKLQDWEFLPLWMHSLEPYDEVVKKVKFAGKGRCCACCCRCESGDDFSSSEGSTPRAISPDHLSEKAIMSSRGSTGDFNTAAAANGSVADGVINETFIITGL